MNLGDNIVLKDIALFSQSEAEEAAMVMRYFYNKEKSSVKKTVYQNCLDKLEEHLLLAYTVKSQTAAEALNRTKE